MNNLSPSTFAASVRIITSNLKITKPALIAQLLVQKNQSTMTRCVRLGFGIGQAFRIKILWFGKTRTTEEKAASCLYMQNPDNTASYLKAADTKPSLLLKGDTPRLIDEWQMAPVLWDAVRFTVDQRGENGQFILTGSAVPSDNCVTRNTVQLLNLVTEEMMEYILFQLAA